MKKNIKVDTGIVIIILFIIFATVFIYGGKEGWFKNLGDVYNIDSDTITKLESTQLSTSQCSASLSKSTIIEGESITASIKDGVNTLCQVYGKADGTNDWRLITEGTTNANGDLSYTEIISTVGIFNFRVICGNCITNQVTLKVNPITAGCRDTDGKNKLTPGFVTYGSTYYDDCTGNWAVKEYYCNGNTMAQEIIGCDPGTICFETRGGDYCRPIASETACGDSYPSCDGTCPSGEICNKLSDHCVCIPSTPPPEDHYHCCYSMGLYTCYIDSCPPASQDLGVYDTSYQCNINCQDKNREYTCGISQWCQSGTCPVEYTCQQLDSLSATWCGCINERLGIVHPDWKVGGKYYNPR